MHGNSTVPVVVEGGGDQVVAHVGCTRLAPLQTVWGWVIRSRRASR